MHSIRHYDWALHLATIVLCAYFLARAVTIYTAGVLESVTASAVAMPTPAAAEAPSKERDDGGEDAYRIIVDRNVFSSKTVAAPEAASAALDSQQLGALGPAVKTGLDVKVRSTLVMRKGTGRRSSAIVSSGKARTGKAYFIGDDEESFAPNVKLVKVARDRIEFINGGRLEYAEVEGFVFKTNIFAPPEEVFGKISLAKDNKGASGPGVSAPLAGKILVDQKDIDNALQNLDRLQGEVRIVPNFQNGQMAGFRVLSIKPGGLVSKLGVRRGDVLEKVNGQELDIRRGLELFNSLKDSKTFSLDVLRGGQTQTIEYEIR